MQGVFSSPKVVVGPGAIEALSGLGARRPLVVVDPALARADAHRRVVEELEKPEGSVASVFSDVTIEPSVADIERGVGAVRSASPDLIVAVGGGSTIDTAKALWVRFVRPDLALETVTPIVELGLRARTGFVAIPTTSGSGSEATWTAELRTSEGRPFDLATRELVPDWALLDPALVSTVPPASRADAAADLVGHAIEALGSEWANPFSDAVARDALATAFTVLPKLAKHPGDDDAVAALHHAATLAGLAASNAQLGVAHALARALGPSTGLSHGRLVGIVLPYATEFNYPSARDRYARLAGPLGPPLAPNRSALAERLRLVLGALGVPRTLADAGVDRMRAESGRSTAIARAARTPSAVANPRVPSEGELTRLLAAAWDGAAVDF
ncbi:MAG: iron-containing alcohol dehydrogenase [Thermoplasmata archaeon]|nr:iron-containing alcohol dehydrogenase [Thermoplasmata archaeon]MCI4356291.1 iron-containing alcohol dehydrogenase [Thermoplasmata archaeon]